MKRKPGSELPQSELMATLSPIMAPSTPRLVILCFALMGPLFSMVFSNFAVTVAMPDMSAAFTVSSTEISWVLSASLIGWGGLMLLAGRVSDVFGRRNVLLAGLVIFTVFTAASGFINSLLGIYITQGLAGCGTALAIPSSLGIIAANFPMGKARVFAYAALGASGPAAAGSGELISGLLLKTRYKWRTAFFCPAAIALLPLVICFFLVPKDVPDKKQNKKMDWLGAALMTAAITLFLVALTSSQTATKRWAAPYIPPMLVASVLSLGCFLLWQRHLSKQLESPTRTPVLLPLRLFSAGHGKLAGLYACAFFVWTSTDAVQVNVTFYFQNVQRHDPFQAALRFLPVPVLGIIACVTVAVLQTRVTAQAMICTACLLTCGTSIIFALCDPAWPYWYAQFMGMVLVPLATDTMASVGTILVADLVAVEEVSIAQALLATGMRIGGPTGITVSAVVRESIQRKSEQSERHRLALPLNQSLSADSQDQAVLAGLRASMWTSLVCMLTAIILAVIFLRDAGIAGQKQEHTAEMSKECQTQVSDQATDDAELEKGAGLPDPLPALGKHGASS